PIEKWEISEEIKAINNFIGEKMRPLKGKLNKKLKEEEEIVRQSKVYTFREFPYFFFTARAVQNLLRKQLSTPHR
ncbi:MAG: hypothetical protein XD79_0742, partial [Atribacteria bacterium 34_128]